MLYGHDDMSPSTDTFMHIQLGIMLLCCMEHDDMSPSTDTFMHTQLGIMLLMVSVKHTFCYGIRRILHICLNNCLNHILK